MKKIALIYGGESSEREISILTKNNIKEILIDMQYEFSEIEISANIADDIIKNGCSLVINAVHGLYGEDGRLQGLLDIMQIPYTHSGAFASQIGMNKVIAKELASKLGLNILPYTTIYKEDDLLKKDVQDMLQQPFIMKPIYEGSSIGIKIILEPQDFNFQPSLLKYGPLMIEKYIPAKDITVGILNNKAIGVLEIITDNNFYDYDAKYKDKTTRYIKPEMDDQLIKKIYNQSEILHNYIGCNYVSRVDFLQYREELFFLEINTHPGLTQTSLIPKMAKEKDIKFSDIVVGLIDNAKYSR